MHVTAKSNHEIYNIYPLSVAARRHGVFIGLREVSEVQRAPRHANQAVDAAQLVAEALFLGQAPRLLQAVQGLFVAALRRTQTGQLKETRRNMSAMGKTKKKTM